MKIILNFTYTLFLIFFFSGNCPTVSAQSSRCFFDTAMVGEPIISHKNFVAEIKKTCVENSDSCVLQKITQNYFAKFAEINKMEVVVYKDTKIELKIASHLLIDKSENKKLLCYLNLYRNGIKRDSLICYRYNNNADDGVASEQFYYIDTSLNIYLLNLEYDLGVTTVVSSKIFSINKKKTKISIK